MRVLLLMRGCPGVGKSTWIEQNGLKPYTLCADDIRLMCSSPALNISGNEEINQTNDGTVWKILFQLLEIRMQNGEFTVIDATNSKTTEINRYKALCDAYKYRLYCVDFTDVPIDVVKERNANRNSYKVVPEEVIDKVYSRFETQKIPSGVTVIKPDELDSIWLKKLNMDKYNKVHVIGDVHGCNTALQTYLGGELHDDEMYVFLGDFVDRGIENADVVKFLLDIYKKPNVYLLEGNHEKWLWIWANDGVGKSKEFELVTKTQLDNAGIDKKEVRQLYRKIGQCAYFDYAGKTYLITHAGLSALPENLTKVATAQMVRGVGYYSQTEDMANSFVKNTDEDTIQIHGHRNTKMIPIQENERCYNLEGQVEFGGYLRCVELTPDGKIHCISTNNTVFNKENSQIAEKPKQKVSDVADLILEMRNNKYIQEHKFGDISSFNFSRMAFYDKVWDAQTMRARGLYINIPKAKVVARSYDKFFNINERPETKMDMLQYKLSFPATAYVKENGFLGIISYNEADDSLLITTKSSIDGDYANILREVFNATTTFDQAQKIKEYVKNNNVSFVFECVDIEKDPHIIEYLENTLFLLDIIQNDIELKKYSYNEMCRIADEIGLRHKEKAFVLDTWQEFFDWYNTVTAEDYKYNGRNIEGFVVEGQNGYMVKVKLAYYNFWKFMRSVTGETFKCGNLNGKRMGALTTPLANQFYAWVKDLKNDVDFDTIPKDIISLRTMFFETETGKKYIN